MRLRIYAWILALLVGVHFLISRAVCHFCEFTFPASGMPQPVHPEIYPLASRYGIALLFPFGYPYQGYFIRFLGRPFGPHASILFNSLFQIAIVAAVGLGLMTAIRKLKKFSQNKANALDPPSSAQ